MKKWLYWILIGVVIYMIWQSPSSTGDAFQAFFQILGELFSKGFQFLDSLLDGAGSPTVVVDPTIVPSASPSPLG